MNTSGVHFSFLLYQSYLSGRNDMEVAHSVRDTTVERTMHDLAYALGELERMRYSIGEFADLKARLELLNEVRSLLEMDKDGIASEL